jgi:hypothetical protein
LHPTGMGQGIFEQFRHASCHIILWSQSTTRYLRHDSTVLYWFNFLHLLCGMDLFIQFLWKQFVSYFSCRVGRPGSSNSIFLTLVLGLITAECT